MACASPGPRETRPHPQPPTPTHNHTETGVQALTLRSSTRKTSAASATRRSSLRARPSPAEASTKPPYLGDTGRGGALEGRGALRGGPGKGQGRAAASRAHCAQQPGFAGRLGGPGCFPVPSAAGSHGVAAVGVDARSHQGGALPRLGQRREPLAQPLLPRHPAAGVVGWGGPALFWGAGTTARAALWQGWTRPRYAQQAGYGVAQGRDSTAGRAPARQGGSGELLRRGVQAFRMAGRARQGGCKQAGAPRRAPHAMPSPATMPSQPAASSTGRSGPGGNATSSSATSWAANQASPRCPSSGESTISFSTSCRERGGRGDDAATRGLAGHACTSPRCAVRAPGSRSACHGAAPAAAGKGSQPPQLAGRRRVFSVRDRQHRMHDAQTGAA